MKGKGKGNVYRNEFKRKIKKSYMKVMCIDDKPRFNVRQGAKFIIEFGKHYEVISVDEDPTYGQSYVLSIQSAYSYPSFHFSPLSEIDETEFKRNYQTQTA